MIALVRRIGSFSDVDSEGKTDQDILDTLDVVMMDELVPTMSKYHEEYFLKVVTTTITETPNFYPIPSRAVGNTWRDVYYENGSQREYLPRLNREHIPFLDTTPAGVPAGFVVEGDGIVLHPPGNTGTLRISFLFRPGQLVLAANYRKVSSVDSTTSVTVDSTVPTAWTTATTFDVHSSNSGAENRIFDFGASVVSGTTVTFSQLIDGTVDGTRAVAVGDYVVVAEQAAVPALPREAHPILAQAAATRLLEADGDTEMLKISRQTLARQIENAAHLFETRVEGKPKKLANRQSFIWRQSSRGGW